VGLGKGNPYCAAFIAWVNKSCGVFRGTAWSPSWFPTDKIVVNKQIGWDKAEPGDVFGLYFASKKRIAHVGLIKEIGIGHIITIEANTSPSATSGTSSDREGDGVWSKRRMKAGIYQVSNWIK